MRSPQSLREGGGDTPPPQPYHHRRGGNITASSHDVRFQSTLSVHKLKRFNSLILLFRVATFVFSLSSFVFMLTNSRSSPHWFDFDAFSWDNRLQVFAYLLLSAGSAGTALVKTLRGTDTCTGASSFCVQSDISIALGFAGFIFLSFSSLMSGFRVACFLINGSRFHL
ncbi:hypothetical protein Cgig2_013581 [Carnegiea gigantea]|uniref:CASP-like protein n=1 Tax=Carnegiea gigantea TaxID=171969 RepID=A0A9Q1KAJ6_9CARY|nr:hypothetical protein Cgig2_013581 [Carnegiea gigantea]